MSNFKKICAIFSNLKVQKYDSYQNRVEFPHWPTGYDDKSLHCFSTTGLHQFCQLIFHVHNWNFSRPCMYVCVNIYMYVCVTSLPLFSSLWSSWYWFEFLHDTNKHWCHSSIWLSHSSFWISSSSISVVFPSF